VANTGLLSPIWCSETLSGFLSRHKPQTIEYDEETGTAEGVSGKSYTKSWAISTYCATSPETYVHSHFTKKYGAPRDEELWRYVQETGTLQHLMDMKEEFLGLRGEIEGLPLELTSELIASTEVGQMFLTVQPSQSEMNGPGLDTFLQPHYDPSSLTINIHLSPVDYKGCNEAENGLLVMNHKQGEPGPEGTVYPTPQGSVVFIWDGDCLHTGNNIAKGERVVLCTFWKQPRELRDRVAAAKRTAGATRPRSVGSMGLPLVLSSPPHRPPPRVESLPRGLYKRDGWVLLNTDSLLPGRTREWIREESASLDPGKGVDGLEWSIELTERTESWLEGKGPGGACRGGCRGRERYEPERFWPLRQRLAAEAVPGAPQTARGDAVVALLRDRLAAAAAAAAVGVSSPKDDDDDASLGSLYLFNERFVDVVWGPSGGGHGSDASQDSVGWKVDEEEVSWLTAGAAPPSFCTIWIPLDGAHTMQISVPSSAPHPPGGHGEGEGGYVTIRIEPGEAFVIASHRAYRHQLPRAGTSRGESLGQGLVQGRRRLWAVQYSLGAIGLRLDEPLAFAVPLPLSDPPLLQPEENGILTEQNGVVVHATEESEAQHGVFHALRKAGDAVLVPRLAWHESAPSESNRMLLKMVVFFKPQGDSEPHNAREDPLGPPPSSDPADRKASGSGFGYGFSVGPPSLLEHAFHEVFTAWDDLRRLPPGEGQLWSPYRAYRWVQMPLHHDWPQDQLRNVRRVTTSHLPRFLAAPHLRATAELIRAVEAAVRERDPEARLYDLHFLRQVGANAASFSRHQDIHDTGDAATTHIRSGVSILLGGWATGVASEEAADPGEDPWQGYFEEEAAITAATKGVSYLSRPSEEPEPDFEGCSCEGGCGKGCACLALGARAAVGGSGLGFSLFECHEACGCRCGEGGQCGNMASQSPHGGYSSPASHEPVDAENGKGIGVHARVLIPTGAFVVRYLGEPLSWPEAQRRREAELVAKNKTYRQPQPHPAL